MAERSSYQVILEMVSSTPLPQDRLEDLAEACLDAINRQTRLVALGPVVSALFDRNAIEVEFTACATDLDEVNRTMERVAKVMHETVTSADGKLDVAKSSTERVAVPA